MSQFLDLNSRTDPDESIIQIADYVMDYEIKSDEAYETAKKTNKKVKQAEFAVKWQKIIKTGNR